MAKKITIGTSSQNMRRLVKINHFASHRRILPTMPVVVAWYFTGGFFPLIAVKPCLVKITMAPLSDRKENVIDRSIVILCRVFYKAPNDTPVILGMNLFPNHQKQYYVKAYGIEIVYIA